MSSSGPAAPRAQDASALPVGTRLGEFELRGLLGVGGFGIVYLAFDHALEREVAVKEYMPASLAGRTETMHVSLRSQSDAETFALGLRSFVNEARLLARFDHPSLLKVLRFWEANGTAYMAMPVMRGRTLKELRAELGRTPDEATLRSMLGDLLGALERLHGEGVYHRDIAPDNIQIEPDGHPVLLDFGAARRVLSDKTQTLTAILKPAYAPIEQYAETGAVKQGPWTDFYALGATMHYVLLGKPPAPATARAVFDESAPLAGLGLPGFSPAFLQLVDWMLAPKPVDRPQNVAELRQVLLGDRAVPAAFIVEPATNAWDTTQVLPRGLTAGDDATLVIPRSPESAPVPARIPAPVTGPVAITAPAAAAVAPAPPAAVQSALPPQPAPMSAQRSEAVSPPATRRPVWPLAAAAVAALAVAVFALWPKPSSGPTVAAGTSLPAPAAPAIAGDTAKVTAEPPAAMPAPSAAAGPTSTPSAVSPPSASPVAGAVPSQSAAKEPTPKPAQQAQTPAVKPASRNANGPAATAGKTPTEGAATPSRLAPAGEAVAVPATAVQGGAGANAYGPAPNAQAPATSAAPSAKPAATDAPVSSAAGPESKCAGRNPVARFVCMERECLRGSFANHADCQAWRKDAKRD